MENSRADQEDQNLNMPASLKHVSTRNSGSLKHLKLKMFQRLFEKAIIALSHENLRI